MDSSTLLTSALLGLSAFVVYYHLRVFTFWRRRGIDGPVPWPIFGTNIYYILGNKNQVDAKWRQKYGHTFGLFDGYFPILRTSDDKILKQVLIKQFHSFTDRNHQTIHNDNARHWLLWTQGEHWANQRALISPAFTSNKMRSMFAKMTGCIDTFFRVVDKRLESAQSHVIDDELKGKTIQGSDEVQLSKYKLEAGEQAKFYKTDLAAMTLDVIAKSFFSLNVDTYLDRKNEFLQKAYDFACFDLPWFIVWTFIPTPIARYFKLDLIPFRRYQYFDRLSQSIIQERRKAPQEAGRKNDFIQAMLDAKLPDTYDRVYNKEDDKEAHYNNQISYEELERINERQTKQAKLFRSFSDLEIRAQMTFFFMANFETTATTISFALFEMAHNQKAQEEVFQELLAKFGSVDGMESKLEYSDLLDLKKLDAFVSESLRLNAPLIETNRLVTDKEGVLLDTSPPIHLPRNTIISFNTFLIQRDGDYWERPTEFDLSRFYPENRGKIRSCTYMPFGVGPRNCAGMRFALLEIKTCLVKLILKYHVSPGTPNQTYPAEFNQHAFLLQANDICFRLSPRQGV